MKKIKVNYIDMYKSREGDMIFDERLAYIHKRLCNYYDVEVTNNSPDIVFCDFYGVDFIKYDCIRVSALNEEYAPNFNIYDYAITYYQDYSFKDRVYSLEIPIYYERQQPIFQAAFDKHKKEFTMEELKTKTGFCSFVQSKGTGADPARVDFFMKLSEYKKVDSGGKLYNNIGGPIADKEAFEMKHKFAISFINGRNYTMQDRPLTAFASRTIPIYWGNPDIGKVFNTKAFINCHDFNNFEEAIEYVKMVDNDDELYIKMMNEPALVNERSVETEIARFDEFLINIVEHGTVQRSGAYWNKVFEKEIYRGRKKFTRLNRLANRTRPVTRILFKSKAGQYIKKKILNQTTRRGLKDAYRNIR